MTNSSGPVTVRLTRATGQQWGFRLHGGKDFNQPLVILKVNYLQLSIFYEIPNFRRVSFSNSAASKGSLSTFLSLPFPSSTAQHHLLQMGCILCTTVIVNALSGLEKVHHNAVTGEQRK